MQVVGLAIAAASLLAAATNATPTIPVRDADKLSLVERDGTTYTVFEHAATGAKMEFVKNSGICETTPGVNQYSGYLSVGNNMNMWFWFVLLITLSSIPECIVAPQCL